MYVQENRNAIKLHQPSTPSIFITFCVIYSRMETTWRYRKKKGRKVDSEILYKYIYIYIKIVIDTY